MLYFLPLTNIQVTVAKKKKNSQADYTNGNFYTEISNKQAFDFT